MRFCREHSLSIVLGLLTVAMTLASLGATEGGWWHDFWLGYGADAFGAFLIVVASKWFIERGSPASKE